MNPIDAASAALEQAIAQEREAAQARAEAEQRLLSLMPSRDQGALTLRGSAYRASIQYGVQHDVDVNALAALERAVPRELLRQAITLNPVVVPAGLRYLRCNEPDTYTKIIRAITTTRTPSVRVERLVA